MTPKYHLKVDDMFVGVNYTDWINTLNIGGEWATADMLTAIDFRLKVEYRDCYLALEFQDKEKAQINTWIEKWLSSKAPVLDKLYATTQFEYNPIENYNMQESGTDSGNSGSTGSSTGKSTAYDVTTPQVTDSTSSNASAHSSSNHSLTRQGNIGVTTTQQMIEQERNVAAFDFITYVTDLIVANFVCSLYSPNEECEAYDHYFI